MRKTLLFILSMLITFSVWARQLTPNEALANAMSLMQSSQSMRARSLATGATTSRTTLVHTEATGTDVPLYYVFSISDGGFLIASADDRSEGLLGYTDSGDFDDIRQNPAFQSWLSDCTAALKWISTMPDDNVSATRSGTRATTLIPVAPLLGEIKWDQKLPYNKYTPVREAGGQKLETPTGCVATATAQVMMYYKWPETGTGSHTNQLEPTQTVDFSQSVYDWAKMKDIYSETDDDESADAVARLMYDLGCALDMNYDPKVSLSNSEAIVYAMATYFKYDKGISIHSRSSYGYEQWNELLRAELQASRPVLFAGSTPSREGHQFVLDGYDANGLYHVNWGWGGKANGYFAINYLNSAYQGTGGAEGGFNMDQKAVTNVMPDKDGTSTAKPILEILSPITYDSETNKLTFAVQNNGLGDFTGSVGILMTDPEGHTTVTDEVELYDNPFPFCRGGLNMSFIGYCPTDVQKAGYIVMPFYKETPDGEAKVIPVPANAHQKLISYLDNGNVRWRPLETGMASLTFTDIEVLRCHEGFKPKFKFSVTNSADARNDYFDRAAIVVFHEVEGEMTQVCQGYAQMDLNPGDTREYTIECDQMSGNIEAGDYYYQLCYMCGGISYQGCDPQPLTILPVTPSELAYSDFAIDNTTIQSGDTLTASFVVNNTGGFDYKTYHFFVFENGGDTTVDDIKTEVEIHEGSSATVTFTKPIYLPEGEYFGAFFKESLDAGFVLVSEDRFFFTISNSPTSITDVRDSTIIEGQFLDLNGRKVMQLQRGKVYIGKDKVIVR